MGVVPLMIGDDQDAADAEAVVNLRAPIVINPRTLANLGNFDQDRGLQPEGSGSVSNAVH
jgi:hypothetical protein